MSQHEPLHRATIQSLCCVKRLLEVYAVLGWFKGLAAFHAAGSVAWCDESTKWAHPLGREIAVACFHSQEFPQASGHVGPKTTNLAKKRMRGGDHAEIPDSQTTLTLTCRSLRFCATLLVLSGVCLAQCEMNFEVPSEQFRSAIPFCLSHHDCRDEHFFSLFQVL